MSNYATLAGMLATALKDRDAALTAVETHRALEGAVREYSRRRPRLAVADVVGDGSTTLFALPAGWVQDWSHLVQLESPQGEEPPQYLAPSAYRLYQGLTGWQLRFVSAPASGVTVRLTYTALHTLTESTSSVPLLDQQAVATMGAALAAEWMASHYATQTESTLTLDTADHQSRSANYAQRATALREAFDRMVPWRHALMRKVARG